MVVSLFSEARGPGYCIFVKECDVGTGAAASETAGSRALNYESGNHRNSAQ